MVLHQLSDDMEITFQIRFCAYRIIISAEDIQDTLKDLLSETIQDMLETEMDNHLGYGRYERCGEPNYRNGTKPKTVRSKYGEFQVEVPQDRQSSFDPQVLPKRKR